MIAAHNSPAVVEDLRALAEVLPFDQPTRELLERAAEHLEALDEVRHALDAAPEAGLLATLDRIAQAVLL